MCVKANRSFVRHLRIASPSEDQASNENNSELMEDCHIRPATGDGQKQTLLTMPTELALLAQNQHDFSKFEIVMGIGGLGIYQRRCLEPNVIFASMQYANWNRN